MSYKLHSTVVSALLVLTLLWGHCTACPLAFAAGAQQPQQDDHSCCPKPKSGDHCNQPSGKDKQDCPGMAAGAQDYTYKADTGLAAPVTAGLPVLAAEPVLPSTQADAVVDTPVHSPPDLFLRNSTLLI